MNVFKLLVIFITFKFSFALLCYECQPPCPLPTKDRSCYVDERGACVKEQAPNGVARGCTANGQKKKKSCELSFVKRSTSVKCSVCNDENYCNEGDEVTAEDNSRCVWPFAYWPFSAPEPPPPPPPIVELAAPHNTNILLIILSTVLYMF